MTCIFSPDCRQEEGATGHRSTPADPGQPSAGPAPRLTPSALRCLQRPHPDAGAPL